MEEDVQRQGNVGDDEIMEEGETMMVGGSG